MKEERVPRVGRALGIIDELGRKQKLPRHRSYDWAPAMLSSTDKAPPEFKKDLAGKNPDGYLIGVGVGGIFELVDSFTNPPLGMISADINPHIVVAGRILVEVVKTSESFDDFINNFFKLSEPEYGAQVERVLEEDPFLRRGISRWQSDRVETPTPMDAWYVAQKFPEGFGGAINVPVSIRKNFPTLQQLAKGNNIIVALADIADKNFLRAVRSLPEFENKTNVIYLSNAISLPGAKINRYKTLKRLEFAGNRCAYVHRDVSDPNLQVSFSIEGLIDDLHESRRRYRKYPY